jgi:transcriptional antiterminator RfaH
LRIWFDASNQETNGSFYRLPFLIWTNDGLSLMNGAKAVTIKMQNTEPFWYVVRTKPKHEHIAAANLGHQLGLEVFLPRLRVEKLTRRGVVKMVDPLFPCYVFVHCVMADRVADLQHISGVSKIVRFGDKIPQVPDEAIKELQFHFGADDTLVVENHLTPGDEVTLAEGAFAGLDALVLKNLPARKRVQILLEVLGRPTLVEVRREAVLAKKSTLAERAPVLAAFGRQERTGVSV